MDAPTSMDCAVGQVPPADPAAPTPAARSVGPGGGQMLAPAARSGVLERMRSLKASPWFSVATRGTAIFAGMLALSAIGAASTLAGPGVPIPLTKPSAAPSASGVWIAPEAAPSAATEAHVDPPPNSPQPGTSAGVTPDGKVILNLAAAEELMKLPRVGAKRAQAILELRRKLGKFKLPTDLLRVHGIGRKTLKQMLPLVVVDAPAKP